MTHNQPTYTHRSQDYPPLPGRYPEVNNFGLEKHRSAMLLYDVRKRPGCTCLTCAGPGKKPPETMKMYTYPIYLDEERKIPFPIEKQIAPKKALKSSPTPTMVNKTQFSKPTPFLGKRKKKKSNRSLTPFGSREYFYDPNEHYKKGTFYPVGRVFHVQGVTHVHFAYEGLVLGIIKFCLIYKKGLTTVVPEYYHFSPEYYFPADSLKDVRWAQ